MFWMLQCFGISKSSQEKKKKRVKKAVVSSKQIQFSPEKLFAGQWVVSKNAIE